MTTGRLLVGPDAARAGAVVREIADAVARGAGLACAPADRALFWAYVAAELDDAETDARYAAAVDELVAWLAAGAAQPGLYGGLTGAGWVLAHISEPGVADRALAVLDDALLAAPRPGAAGWHFDLVRGAAGLAVYFLERLRAAPEDLAARAGLARVVDDLAAAAEATGDGAAWHTPVDQLPPWQRAEAPSGRYDCGVAHGTPGVLAVLARVVGHPQGPPAARALCADALRWVAGRSGPGGRRGRYPAAIGSATARGDARGCRAAWCYGDPGVAIAMWQAEVALGRAPELGRALALESAARSPDHAGAVDAGLCHGAMGLAHLYGRCFRASGDARFAAAARGWIHRALGARRTDGVAGFAVPGGEPGGGAGDGATWRAETELLGGAIGVGLALLAAIRDEPPEWDRLLVCDLPPSAA